jgi:hypothetical protein
MTLGLRELALLADKQAVVPESVSGLVTEPRKPFINPEGILADLEFDLTEEDMTEARREMRSNFPREDIG